MFLSKIIGRRETTARFLRLQMKRLPGTYSIVFRCRSKATAQVGCWGRLHLAPGYDIYVGSAFGPGGVQARVSRHCRKTKAKHWHIDYLRAFLHPTGAWYGYETARLEHRWAGVFAGIAGMTSIHGFGCSDCKRASHLFRTPAAPAFALFPKRAGGAIETWLYPSADGTSTATKRLKLS